MIHLALSILAFYFLASLAVGAILGLVLAWRWVLGVLACLAVVAFVIDNKNNVRSASTAPSSGSLTTERRIGPEKVLPRTLPERLRYEPRIAAQVPHGEAWYVSAMMPDQEHYRIIVLFKSSNNASILDGEPTKALTLLRQSLCESNGILNKYQLDLATVSIVAYEDNNRVGEVELPRKFCERPDALEAKTRRVEGQLPSEPLITYNNEDLYVVESGGYCTQTPHCVHGLVCSVNKCQAPAGR